MRIVVLITIAASISLLVGCPARQVDPTQGVRDTFEQGLAFIRAGEYEKVWTLYSVEYRERIAEGFRVQKEGIRTSLANNAYDVDKLAMQQTGMTAKQYLAASPREIEAATIEVLRQHILRSRIDGKINIEGDIAYVRIIIQPGDLPADYRFVHRNGRWLYHDRSFMPVR